MGPVMKRIYFDYAATAPADPLVLEAMRPYFFEKFGNASSPHTIGQEAKRAVEEAREVVANFIGALTEEIVFTSSGTESNNHALIGVAQALAPKGNHLIISKIEHHCVTESAAHLEKQGFQISRIKVDQDGLVNPVDIQNAITDKTILVSVMHANNEIGTVQPIAEIGKITRTKGVVFHIDAVQSVGHIPVNVSELNADMISMSVHKFYGPPGVGALYIRKGTKILPLLRGGDQERGRRAATLNLPGIIGMAKALQICQQTMSEESSVQKRLRDKIITEVPKRIEQSKLNGHLQMRLPNNVNFSFSGVDGEALLMSLDMVGICASMGSACTSGAMEASHVLRAIGLPEELAYGSLRISLGRWNTEGDVDYFLEQLPVIINRLRAVSS